MKARFFEPKGQKIQCQLCPHRCLIPPGRHGICGVRYNREGVLDLPFYGRLSSVADDPIEKKPLYHFHPGRSILSIGFVGCSFHCPFCQNYRISQSTDIPTDYLSPEALVDLAVKRNSLGIAYTYSEPLIHLEYVLDTARIVRRRGLKNVLVSNGYLNPEPAAELLEWLDAANIDLKSFNPQFYAREIGGKLEEVKRFIRQAAGKILLEVTTLVIPGKNDGEAEILEMAQFLASLDPGIPYHLSAYYPQHHYRLPPTPPATIQKLAQAARRHLRFVYPGNIGPGDSDTLCSQCGQALVRRRGFSARVEGILKGRCRHCGASAPIVGL